MTILAAFLFYLIVFACVCCVGSIGFIKFVGCVGCIGCIRCIGCIDCMAISHEGKGDYILGIKINFLVVRDFHRLGLASKRTC